MISFFQKIELLWKKMFNGYLFKYRFGIFCFGVGLNIFLFFSDYLSILLVDTVGTVFANAAFHPEFPLFNVIERLTDPGYYIPALFILFFCYILGNIMGWAAFEKKEEIDRMNRKTAFLERLLSTSPVGAFMTDDKGVVTFTNSEAHKILTQNVEESVVGRNLRDIDLIANTVLTETVEKLENSYAGMLQKEIAFKKNPQSPIEWFHCSFSPVVLDSERIGSIGWIHDRTQQKRKQEDVINSIILALTKAIDAKDTGTHEHSMRVRKISLTIAKNLNLPAARFPTLEYAALLHDVGKILIPDDILQGRAELNEEQKQMISRLPEYSASFLEGIEDLEEVREIVYHQREWYVPPKNKNSRFKPFPGLKTGDSIPLESRIIAVADAFEGMTTEKGYRKAMPKEVALIEFKRSSGIKPTEAEINRLIYHYKETKRDKMGLEELLSHSRVERQFDYKIVRALENAVKHNEL